MPRYIFAWLREYGKVYQDSSIHIHAIAVGDRELSAQAEAQLTGPVICQWMIDLGYRDLR